MVLGAANRFQLGSRVRVINYNPFRGLKGTVQKVHAIDSIDELFCFYLIQLEGGYTKEPIWFFYEEVESISGNESDHLNNL